MTTLIDPVNELKKYHTKQLLQFLSSARACGNWYSPCDSHSSYGFTYDEIKSELSLREHVPNKKEGIALRREAAKRKR